MRARWAILTVPLPVLVAVTARRRLFVVTVRGVSMLPTYEAGDRVLFRRGARVQPGQVVVLRMPAHAERVPDGAAPDGESLLVKRVTAVAGEPLPVDVPPGRGTVPAGHLVVRGDARRSDDSRHWGAVPAGLVEGVAVVRLGAGRHDAPGRDDARSRDDAPGQGTAGSAPTMS